MAMALASGLLRRRAVAAATVASSSTSSALLQHWRAASSIATDAIRDASLAVADEKWIKLMHQTSKLETNVLLPLNERLLGPLDRKHAEEKLPSLPFVFLLGNHSSGKSTFINYLLQREVQSTGVAPTDDGFTIIAPGSADMDQDGPALVGDPDLGFSGLRSYGPALVQRTQLKVRSGITANYMLVDSPGMIDSPKSVHTANSYYSVPPSLRSTPNNSLTYRGTGESSDRGYEFPEVVRWYAERADVILLFFDPDKPGTTGETLSVLTNSLVGMDHKLHIVLNKVDQFRKIHDFARAYGSLCWNLSKVIPLKDLPRIYTMCVPTTGSSNKTESGLGDASLRDLDAMRDEVVAAVVRAPERRVDNLITNLYDAARLLQMHARIVDDVRSRYRHEQWRRYALVGTLFVGGNALAAAAVVSGAPLEVAAAVAVGSVVGSGGLMYHASSLLAELERALVSEDALSDQFRRLYGRQLAEGDEYVLALWKRVLPAVQVAIHTLGMRNIPKVKASEVDAIERIVAVDVPALRRQCAPAETSLAHQVAHMFRS